MQSASSDWTRPVRSQGEVPEGSDVPPPPPPPPRRTAYPSGYKPRGRNPFFGAPVILVLLVFIAALAVLYRKPLTEQFDRLFGTPQAAKPVESANPSDEGIIRHEPTLPSKKETPVEPKVERKVNLPPQDDVKSDEPGLEVEHEPTMLIHKKRPSGMAWAPLEPAREEGFGAVSRLSIKVLVPAKYGKAELAKVAQDVVREELKRRSPHAMRMYFYGDRLHLRPEDAIAVAEWGPGGDYNKADDAVRLGSNRNEIKVNLLRSNGTK